MGKFNFFHAGFSEDKRELSLNILCNVQCY